MLSKNKLRVLVAFFVVSAMAFTLVGLATYSYIKRIRADNVELYKALIEEDRIIRAKATGCQLLLSDPIVMRIMAAPKRVKKLSKDKEEN